MAEQERLPARLRFGVFEADLESAELYRDGRRVALQRQPFLLLAALLERPGEMVGRDELQQRLWPADTFVDFDHGLATAVKKLRFALGDSAQSPRFVETLEGRGFRFIAPLDRAQLAPRFGGAVEAISDNGLSAAAPIASPVSTATSSVSRSRRLAALAGLLMAVAGWAVWRSRPARDTTPRPVMRLDLLVPSTGSSHLLNVGNPDATLVLSPDGSRLVYAVRNLDRIQLYARTLSELDAHPIAGTEGGAQAFFSPDGTWIGFGNEGTLRKVPADGGKAITLCDAPELRGASWGEDGTILFAPRSDGGLFRVGAAGGEPVEVTRLEAARDEMSHRWPQVLPGGKAAIFTTVAADGSEYSVEAVLLATGERRRLLEGAAYARYLSGGHLLYALGTSLFVAPFDPEALRITGESDRVSEPAQLEPGGKGLYLDVSASGTLAYLRTEEEQTALFWVDRNGRTSPVPSAPDNIQVMSLSPDGRRVAAWVGTDWDHLETWVGDLDRQTWSRVKSTSTLLWSSDGRKLLDGEESDLSWVSPDGNAPEPLAISTAATPTGFRLDSMSPDGKLMTFGVDDPETGADLWVVPLLGDHTPRPLVQAPGPQGGASFSPDGRFFAYVHNGHHASPHDPCEIIVQPYPVTGEQWRLTRGHCGWWLTWSRDGREIFYRLGSTMFAVPVKTSPRFEAGAPHELFTASFAWTLGMMGGYSAAPDGQRFLVLADVHGGTAQLVVVPNWIDNQPHGS